MVQRYYTSITYTGSVPTGDILSTMVKDDNGEMVTWEDYDKDTSALRGLVGKLRDELKVAIKYIDDLEALNPGMDKPESEEGYR